MIWLLLVFGILALAKQTKNGAPPLPPKIGELDFNDPAQLMEAAKQAQDAGAPETAKALASVAQDTSDIAKAIESTDVAATSPIAGVPANRWNSFVALFRGPNLSEISAAYHLGLFNVGYLRLRDLDLASDVKQTTHQGKTVWKGRLKPPMTERGFLSNPAVQYQVFAKDMRERAHFIREHYAGYIGRQLVGLEGLPVTLSGLLAVIKLAGTKGFTQWITDPREREKFERTTAAFKTANGLF